MGRALLRLANDKVRDRAVTWVKNVPDGTTVEFKSPRRTLEANAKLWACLTDIAQQVTWYGAKLNAEDWKDVLSASLRKARVVPGIDPGTYVPLGMRTSEMTKDEFAQLIELALAFGAERGVVFQDDAP